MSLATVVPFQVSLSHIQPFIFPVTLSGVTVELGYRGRCSIWVHGIYCEAFCDHRRLMLLATLHGNVRILDNRWLRIGSFNLV